MRPVNISENLAVFNSGCASKAFAMAFAASTPRVLPVSVRNCRSGHVLIASTMGLAAKSTYVSGSNFLVTI